MINKNLIQFLGIDEMDKKISLVYIEMFAIYRYQKRSKLDDKNIHIFNAKSERIIAYIEIMTKQKIIIYSFINHINRKKIKIFLIFYGYINCINKIY